MIERGKEKRTNVAVTSGTIDNTATERARAGPEVPVADPCGHGDEGIPHVVRRPSRRHHGPERPFEVNLRSATAIELGRASAGRCAVAVVVRVGSPRASIPICSMSTGSPVQIQVPRRRRDPRKRRCAEHVAGRAVSHMRSDPRVTELDRPGANGVVPRQYRTFVIARESIRTARNSILRESGERDLVQSRPLCTWGAAKTLAVRNISPLTFLLLNKKQKQDSFPSGE